MKREPFVAEREERWRALEKLVRELESLAPRGKSERFDASALPSLYRRLCQDLALARKRVYGRELVQRLNELALRGREQLYRRPMHLRARAIDFVGRGFPRLVRENARLFWLAFACFYGPFFAMMLCAKFAPEFLYRVLDPQSTRMFEDMYDPSNPRIGRGRESSAGVAMFGFYIFHNIGIAFSCFATGILGGVGSILALLFNGLYIGAVFAHLTRIGFHVTLYPFAVGHGAFELTAIVISGAAGMKLGFALLAPGRRTRTGALLAVGPDCARLIYGAAGMLTIAAFIEGFWSPSAAPAALKFAVGGVLWTSVAAYFLFAGRGRAA